MNETRNCTREEWLLFAALIHGRKPCEGCDRTKWEKERDSIGKAFAKDRLEFDWGWFDALCENGVER